MNDIIATMGLPSLEKNETPAAYCNRLEQLGFDEVFIRKTLMAIFNLSSDGCLDCFRDLSLARLRYVALLAANPNTTWETLRRHICRYLGISEDEADLWISRYHARRGVTYRDWFPPHKKHSSG